MGKRSRSLICDKCGGRLKWERYKKDGERFRKYYCPKCGFKEVFKRVGGYY